MSFDEFWSDYPRKVSRGAAQKAYLKALKIATHDEIVSGLQRFLDHLDSESTERKFIPHGSTWLNGERWADEYRAKRVEVIVDTTKNRDNLRIQLASMEAKEAMYGYSLEAEKARIRAQLEN